MVARGNGAFGALLKRLRLAAGLTQEALAERAGLSVKALSELERDPPARRVWRVSRCWPRPWVWRGRSARSSWPRPAP